MKTSKLFDVYAGVWSHADRKHTPMLLSEHSTLRDAKKATRSLQGHWWIVERVERVVYSFEDEVADA